MKLLMYLFCFAAGIGIQPISYFQFYGNFTIIDLVIIVFFPLCLLQRGTLAVPKNGQKIIVVIFLLALWQMISFLFSPVEIKIANFGPNVRLLYYVLILLLFFEHIQEEIHLVRMSQYFISGLIVNLVHSFYLWSLEPIYFWGVPILNNTYLSRNPLYYYTIFGIVITISLAKLSNNLKLSYFYYFFTSILTTVAFLTFSKGAWILLIVIWGLFILMYLRKAIVPFILILGLIVLFFNTISLDIQKVFFVMSRRISASVPNTLARLEFIATGIRMGLDHFLFGIGLRNFPYVSEKYSSLGQMSDPHNVYIMIFSETGIIGLILYILILLFIINDLKKTLKFIHQRKDNYSLVVHWKTAFIMLIIILLLNMVTGMAFTDKFFYFFLIYVEGLRRITQKKDYIKQ